ncbi:MAG: MFS transporter [Labilithrix sp.]|nr:MFS transporter [Labilithrix sp.]MCW5817027.1 MFS transporter [Labilithrix sp.]
MLLVLPLLDELAGGLAVASSPTLSRETGSGLVSYSAALLTLPMLASFLEAPILAWTDRAKTKRHLVVCAGLAGMALSLAVLSFARDVYGLGVAMFLYGPASGLALGTAESMLVDGAPANLAARRLARWEVFGALGDVLAPAAIACAQWTAVDWRTTFRLAAACLFGIALASLAHPHPRAAAAAEREEEEDEPHEVTRAAAAEEGESREAPPAAAESVLVSLREALVHRPLAAWLFGAALCTLLDEMLAVLVALWVTERFAVAVAAPALVAFSLGCVAGGLLLERALLRTSTRTAVVVSSIGCVIAMGGWLAAASAAAVIAWGFVVGVCAGPLHPLAKAEAFATMPARPGLVNGAAQAFVAIDVLAPVVLAAIASRWGARVAIASLALQPVGLLAIALATRRNAGPRGPRVS